MGGGGLHSYDFFKPSGRLVDDSHEYRKAQYVLEARSRQFFVAIARKRLLENVRILCTPKASPLLPRESFFTRIALYLSDRTPLPPSHPSCPTFLETFLATNERGATDLRGGWNYTSPTRLSSPPPNQIMAMLIFPGASRATASRRPSASSPRRLPCPSTSAWGKPASAAVAPETPPKTWTTPTRHVPNSNFNNVVVCASGGRLIARHLKEKN